MLRVRMPNPAYTLISFEYVFSYFGNNVINITSPTSTELQFGYFI